MRTQQAADDRCVVSEILRSVALVTGKVIARPAGLRDELGSGLEGGRGPRQQVPFHRMPAFVRNSN